jgi:hypothetical protein
MTLRHVSGALTAVVLISGLWTVAPAQAQRDASLLPPEEHAELTVAGCLQLGGKDGDEFVLASPRLGPIDNVPVGTCNSTVDDRALQLRHTEKVYINQSMLGHLIEVNGKLEKEEDDNLANLREIKIRSFRVLPVVPPQRAEAPAPVRQPEYTPPPAEPIAPPQEPVGTSGVEPALPQTASPLHLMGLLGMLSLAGGLGLRFYR